MMRASQRNLVLASAVAAALALSGCGGTAVSGSGGNESTKTLVSVPGFDAATKTITVGSLVPTSGPFAPAITNITGQEAWFHRATQPGGPLEGYTVKVKNADTEFNASVAVPLYQSMNKNVLMITNILGDSIINALLPQMQSDQMLVVPGASSEPGIQDPNLLPFGPVYATYSASGVDYMASEEGLADGTFCSMVTDDTFGEGVEKGFNFAVAERGLKKGINLRYPAAQQDFTPQISRLKEANCDVVNIGGVGPALIGSAVRAVQLNFDAKWIASNTLYLNTIATGPAADYIQKNARFFMTGTEWGDAQVEGQKMLEEDLAVIDPKAVPYANSYQTGYMTGITATAVIKKGIEDGDLSRKHLLEIAASLDTIDDYGLSGGFTYGKKLTGRVPGHLMSAFTVDAGAATGLKLKTYNFDSPVAKKYNETQINN